jgi:5'-nucleotidase
MSYGPDNVNFYQVAGMTVTYDLSREPGHRVVSIEVDGKDLDTETAYYIALHDYLATGGGGNRAFVSYDMEIIMDYKWAAANYIEYLETIDESSVQLGRLIRI